MVIKVPIAEKSDAEQEIALMLKVEWNEADREFGHSPQQQGIFGPGPNRGAGWGAGRVPC